MFLFRRCPRPCRATLRLRSGTFFEPWKEMTLPDLIYGLHLWSVGCKAKDIKQLTLLPHDVVTKLCQRLRDCCTTHLQRNPVQVGGNGANFVVQIDETQMHHRQRVSSIIVIY